MRKSKDAEPHLKYHESFMTYLNSRSKNKSRANKTYTKIYESQ